MTGIDANPSYLEDARMTDTLHSLCPATGALVWEGPIDQPDAVSAAVARSRIAQTSWHDRPLEARLEIASLRDTVQSIEASACAAAAAKPRGRYDRDLQRVSGELRVALAAEDKSKRAMEELVLALKEVKAELHTTRQQLARAQREAETARLESDRLHVSVKRKDDKLRALSDEVARLRAENTPLRGDRVDLRLARFAFADHDPGSPRDSR